MIAMKYKVTLNGKTYEVEVEADKAMLVDEYAAFAPAAAPVAAPAAPAAVPAAAPAAAPAAGSAGGNAVKAPMPGTVLKIACTAGAKVKAGDLLIVLEAMKMENEIMAPKDGTVTAVSVSKGSSVESGTLLCTIA